MSQNCIPNNPTRNIIYPNNTATGWLRFAREQVSHFHLQPFFSQFKFKFNEGGTGSPLRRRWRRSSRSKARLSSRSIIPE